MSEKTNYHDIDTDAVLQKIENMDSKSWNYTCQNTNERHYCLCEETFHDNFGDDGYGTISKDKNTFVKDYCGILLMAVKELIIKNKALETQVASLESRVNTLEGN
jgi:hypothetical protein